MSNDWRIILRFAVLGLAATALYLAYQVLIGSSSLNNSSEAVFIVLCPASLLFAPLFAGFFEAAAVGTSLFYVLWSFVGLINAVLYAFVGAAYVGLRKKTKGPAAS